MGGASYAYDGDGDRHSRTVSGLQARYTLDKQTALTTVIEERAGAFTRIRYLHGPAGLLGQQNNVYASSWATNYPLEDGLGSVRALSDGGQVLSAQAYSPYGEQLQTAIPSEFGFTGEQ